MRSPETSRNRLNLGLNQPRASSKRKIAPPAVLAGRPRTHEAPIEDVRAGKVAIQGNSLEGGAIAGWPRALEMPIVEARGVTMAIAGNRLEGVQLLDVCRSRMRQSRRLEGARWRSKATPS
eukprot:15260906-Alexandrium_andersonii.AAC.1